MIINDYVFLQVEFPKFKMEESFSLKDALSSLGMTHMFDKEKADFSKMTGEKDLFVSAVLHKAFIEVSLFNRFHV